MKDESIRSAVKTGVEESAADKLCSRARFSRPYQATLVELLLRRSRLCLAGHRTLDLT